MVTSSHAQFGGQAFHAKQAIFLPGRVYDRLDLHLAESRARNIIATSPMIVQHHMCNRSSTVVGRVEVCSKFKFNPSTETVRPLAQNTILRRASVLKL
jgi:hypothetical protein